MFVFVVLFISAALRSADGTYNIHPDEECGSWPYEDRRVSPWAVAIAPDRNFSVAFYGTLITSHIVIAAAHYFNDNIKIEDWNVYFSATGGWIGATKVNEIVFHPDYNSAQRTNDLVLLDLSTRESEPGAWPACVEWLTGSYDFEFVRNLRKTVYGKTSAVVITPIWSWGELGSDIQRWVNGVLAPKQRDEILEYQPERRCRVWDYVHNFGILKNVFCASKRTELDISGGFITKRNQKEYIIGVHTLDLDDGQLAVFTDIDAKIHKEWIESTKTRLERERIVKEGACKLPEMQENRLFTRGNCEGHQPGCNLTPGELLPHGEFVTVTCAPDHFMVQGFDNIVENAFSKCNQGRWVTSIPQCQKVCRGLTSLTLNLECRLGNSPVKCDKSALPGTVVTFSCKPYHESNEKLAFRPAKCESDGNWSRYLPICTSNCGRSKLDGYEVIPTIVGGNVSEGGNFPWHAGIYHNISNNWETKCGGTLISSKVILTAAHCITTDNGFMKAPALKPQDVMVSLGKLERDWNSIETNETKQSIKQILVHPNYFGKAYNHENDIALLVLEKEVAISNYVMPACVDFDMKYHQQLADYPSQEGYIAGWGLTEECTTHGNICSKFSDKLKYARTAIISYDACLNITQHIIQLPLAQLSRDKFCAFNGSESVVQSGDSGGGLTFKFNGLHHVYGVVSIKLKQDLKQGVKKSYSFGAFTNVSYHLEWLKNELSV